MISVEDLKSQLRKETELNCEQENLKNAFMSFGDFVEKVAKESGCKMVMKNPK